MPQGNKQLRPTVIGPSGASLRKSADAALPAGGPAHPAPTGELAPVVHRPTAIPGAERVRIDVGPGELEAVSPGASAQAYAAARALIDSFLPDKATERKAILWAQELQKAYSELVTEALTLSRAPVLRKVEAYLSRTMDILGSIDLLAVCGHGSHGVLGRMLQRVNDRIDTPGELAQAHAELEKLVALMTAAQQELMDLKDRLLRVAEGTDAAAVQLEAAAIAALFLSRRLADGREAIAQRLAERAMSLTQTLALIREGGTTRNLQLEQPMRMIGAIQNVALVMLPGFIGSIASVAALSGAGTPVTPTEAGELGYRLRDIIERLKS